MEFVDVLSGGNGGLKEAGGGPGTGAGSSS